MKHIPTNYNVANHVAKIAQTPPFSLASQRLGLRPADFEIEVAQDVKRVVAERAEAELAAFEQDVAGEALAATIKRLEAAAS